MEDSQKIIELIELCLIPKLSKNYDEKQSHREFEIRNKRLDENFQKLLKYLEQINLRNDNSGNITSHLIILFYELSNCSWNSANNIKLADKLNYYFEIYYEVNIKNIISSGQIFNNQLIFDKCIEILHGKLTANCFKQYPGQIDAYHSLLKDLKNYSLAMAPSKVFPASLHLIDDYIVENKLKGLECCHSVLLCLNEEHFKEGNYYEVIYLTLKKVMTEKDVQVTKLVFQCLIALYGNLPLPVKHNKLDDMYTTVLEELYMESNLYRKAECLKFTKDIISIHKIHCGSSSMIQVIIADNLELCFNGAVSEILLSITLETFKEWLKYCWCIWELNAGSRTMSALLKLLYLCKDDNLVSDIQGIIITLISCCTKKEKKNIINSFINIDSSFNEEFLDKLSVVLNEFMIYTGILFLQQVYNIIHLYKNIQITLKYHIIRHCQLQYKYNQHFSF